MKYGLEDAMLESICSALARFPNLERAVLCGSRAKGTYKPMSDIDIALFGNKLNDSDLTRIKEAAANLGLPYEFDIFICKKPVDSELEQHIKRSCAVIYEK